MKKLFLFILLLVLGFLSRGQTGTPTSSDILTIYVPKSSIDRSISLRLVDQKTFTNTNFLSYRSGRMSYECVYQGYRNYGTRRVSDNVSSISCGRYNSYYRRPTTITIPYSNTETVVAYEYEVSGHRKVTTGRSGSFEICSSPEVLGLTSYANAPDIYIGHIVYLTSGVTYSGSCSGEWVAGSKTPSEYTAIRAYSYPFASKGDKHVTLGTSGGSLNLKSTTYWTRTTLPINYGNMTFKAGTHEGDNSYGAALTESTGGLNLSHLYDLLSGGDNREVTITATLPYYNGSTATASFVLELRGTSYRFKSKGNKSVCAVGSVNLRSSTYWSRFSSNNFVPSNASVVFSLSDNRASSALTGYTLNLANLYDLLPNTNSGDRGVTVNARLSYSGINVDASFVLTLQGIPSFSIPSNTFSNVVNNRQTFCNNSGSKVISTLSNVTWSGSHVSNNRFNTNTASNSSYTLTATRSRTGTGGCVVRRTATTNVAVITPSVNLSSGNVLKYCDYNSDVALGSIVGTPSGGSFSYLRNSANKLLVVSNGLIRISSTGAGTYPIVYIKEINGCIGSARQDIVINPRPAIPSIVNVANHERCGPGSITLGVSHPESGDGNYIWKSSSGSLIGGFTDNTYQQNYINTTARKVIFKKASTGCESLERDLEAKVKPVPTAPTLSQTNSVCGSGVVNLRASHANNNVSFKWYTTSSSVSSFRSSSTYNTPTIIPYYVSAVLEGCPSSRAVINASVNAIPGTPDVDNSLNFACSTSDALTLSVRGALANESYRWYTALTGGVSIASTSQHTLFYDDNENVTFYVSKVNDVTGCEGSRVEVNGVWREKRGAPILVGGSNCGAGNVSLSASHDGTGISYQWYSSVSNVPVGNPVSLSSTYSPYLTSSKDYVVSVVDEDECVSAFASVQATIYDVPDAPVLVGDTVCGVDNATMSVENPVSGYIYKWYNTINSLSSVSEGVTYTPNISATSTFYVEAVSSEGCVSSGRTQVVGVVNPIPDVPIFRDSIRCGPGEVELRAFHNDEGHFIWYETDVSTTEISGSEAASYTTPELNATRSYFVKFVDEKGCDSERVEVVVTII